MVNASDCESGESSSPLLSKSAIVDGFSDYKGRPVLLSNSGGWRAAIFIIGVELSERFAFFGVSPNLIIYLTGSLGQSLATAAQNVNMWSGVAFFLPLLGAIVADSFLGRYKTIIIASSVYILALGLLTLSAELSSAPQFQVTLFFFSIYLMAFAQGGHRPCVQAFGADQFRCEDPEESNTKRSYFNWWYFISCASVGVSTVLMSYVQEYLNWTLAFGIPCISMVIALLSFLLGTTTYRFSIKSSDKNPFLRIGGVYARALKNWRCSVLAKSTEKEAEGTCPRQSSEQFKYLHKALLKESGSEKADGACEIIDVEDAKVTLRLVPIWLSCLVYAIVFAQYSTFFTAQGKTMDRTIWPGFQIPAASLLVFISITALFFVPLYERILVPITRALTGYQSGITTLQRIGTGIFISITTMVVAALVETKRLKTASENGLVDLPEATVPMSVCWLLPQYVLCGIHEVFTIAALQHFFYDEVASDMKSLGPALALSVIGVGNILSVIFIYVVEKFTGGDSGWLCNNLNQAHLDYYYWLLAGLSTAGFVVYLYSAKSYIYR